MTPGVNMLNYLHEYGSTYVRLEHSKPPHTLLFHGSVWRCSLCPETESFQLSMAQFPFLETVRSRSSDPVTSTSLQYRGCDGPWARLCKTRLEQSDRIYYLLNLPDAQYPSNAIEQILGLIEAGDGNPCYVKDISKDDLFLALVISTVRTVFATIVSWTADSMEVRVEGEIHPAWDHHHCSSSFADGLAALLFVREPKMSYQIRGDILAELVAEAHTSSIVINTGCNVSQFAPDLVYRTVFKSRKQPATPPGRVKPDAVIIRAAPGTADTWDIDSHAHACWRTIFHIACRLKRNAVCEHRPLAIGTIKPHCQLETCASCGKDVVGNGVRCVGCHYVQYCDRMCQQYHWLSAHWSECHGSVGCLVESSPFNMVQETEKQSKSS